MEVIQWTALWNLFKDEFENEKNMLGGSLGDKAAENFRERVIEHVNMLTYFSFHFSASFKKPFDNLTEL